jgi:zinc transporter ZupT
MSAERMNSSTSLFPKTRPSYDTRRSRRESKISLAGDDDDEEEQGGLAGLNATLGLVIHAMADGIALGASSLSEKGGLGFVVFLAVIVHKGEFDPRSALLVGIRTYV